MNNLAWKWFSPQFNLSLEAFNFTVVYSGSYFTQRCSCHAYLTSFCMMSRNVPKLTTNNGGLRVQLPTLPISKSIFFQQSGWRLVLSKGATFYLKPIIFWIYNTCYLVLFCEMMGKSMPLTMQNVPRPSVKFERLLIGYISKCRDWLSISIVASISQP